MLQDHQGCLKAACDLETQQKSLNEHNHVRQVSERLKPQHDKEEEAIDTTITARGYLRSKELSLGIYYISDDRQIDTLLTQLVNTISSSNKMSHPRDMIVQATVFIRIQYHVFEITQRRHRK